MKIKLFLIVFLLMFTNCFAIDFGKFIEKHPKMNIAYKVLQVKQTNDWAQGTRYIVTTTTGTYTFYLKNDVVVTVKEYPNGKELFRKK